MILQKYWAGQTLRKVELLFYSTSKIVQALHTNPNSDDVVSISSEAGMETTASLEFPATGAAVGSDMGGPGTVPATGANLQVAIVSRDDLSG